MLRYRVVITSTFGQNQIMSTTQTFDTLEEAEKFANINRIYPHEGTIYAVKTVKEVVRTWKK